MKLIQHKQPATFNFKRELIKISSPPSSPTKVRHPGFTKLSTDKTRISNNPRATRRIARITLQERRGWEVLDQS